jgi:hypothetical protein
VLVQLAEALRRAGKKEEADKRLDAALVRYDELLAKHPEAFADHAALMLLATGRTPARALTLAKTNFAVRKTPEACDLLLSAALFAHDDAEACRAARAALALRYPTPDLAKVATPVAAKCPPAP